MVNNNNNKHRPFIKRLSIVSMISVNIISCVWLLILMIVSTSITSPSSTTTMFAVEAAESKVITSNGVQTNFGDVSYAGGMSYDSERQIIYVSGQVGMNSCFVGVLKRVEAAATATIPSSSKGLEDIHHPTHLDFLSKQIFDEAAICQTISFRKDVDSQPGNALLLTIAEENGLLTDHREVGSRKSTQYGGLVDVQFDSDGKSSEYHPDQSVLIYQTAPITIPRSIANDPMYTNRVYVATMTSESTRVEYRNALGSSSSIINDDVTTPTPNLTPAGGLLKYGNEFSMTVESIRLGTKFSSPEPQWRKPFGVKRETKTYDDNDDTTSSSSTNVSSSGVTVSQILCRQHTHDDLTNGDDDGENHAFLYVVGSTPGSGPAFGVPELNNDTGHGVVAGFITKLNSNTGGLVSSRRFLFNQNENNEDPLSSPLPEDTFIEAVCEGTENEDSIYIVGSYKRIVNKDENSSRRQQQQKLLEEDAGIGSQLPTQTLTPTFYPTQNFAPTMVPDNKKNGDDDNGEALNHKTVDTPFVAKLKASTLETVWQQTFFSTTNARLLGCGVDPESDAIFVAGNIENNGELVNRTTTNLGDDIILIRLVTSDGDETWAKQLGTSENDRLAYGGNGLAILGGGKTGVLLMGDTTGHLYSVSEQDSEIFVVEIDAHGKLPQTTERTGIENSPSALLVKISTPVKVDGAGSVVEGDNNDNATNDNLNPIAPNSKPLDGGTTTQDNIDTSNTSERGHMSFILISVALITSAAASGFYYIISLKNKEKEATKRALVFSYLQNFDLEDIDVKQAATGGFHGTYIGSLANGVNVRTEDWNEVGSVSNDRKIKSIDENTERRLNNMSHSSLVKDILFMDYDDPVSSDGKSDRGIVRDPITYKDNDDNADNRKNISPWGNEII